jgi:hypothetical protein
MFGTEITIDSEILGMLRQLKAVFRNITAKCPSVDAPTVYPKTAAELKDKFLLLYESAYHGEEPIVVDDEAAWLCRVANVPLRCTKVGCASPLGDSTTRPGGKKQQDATVALAYMLAQHQRTHMPAHAVEPFGGLPGLQIFQKALGGAGPSSSHMSLPAIPARLAIEGPPPGFRYGSQASIASFSSSSQDGSQAPSPACVAGAQLGLQDGSQASSVSVAAVVQQEGAATAASAVDAMVMKLQQQLQPKTGNVDNVMKRPAAAPAEFVDGLTYGCSKCRYGRGGCKQCRAVSFTGKRLKK